MPQATATVNGVEVARTSTWEIVDGNIYVPHPILFNHLIQSPLSAQQHRTRITVTDTQTVPTRLYSQIALHAYLNIYPLSLQGRCKLLHCDNKQDRDPGRGLVLPQSVAQDGEN